VGRARAISNRAFAETIVVEADGHGNGHGNGHGPGEEHAAVGAGPAGAEEQAELAPGELPESSIPHTDPLLWHSHEEPPEES
jgi:hypothetical protein